MHARLTIAQGVLIDQPLQSCKVNALAFKKGGERSAFLSADGFANPASRQSAEPPGVDADLAGVAGNIQARGAFVLCNSA